MDGNFKCFEDFCQKLFDETDTNKNGTIEKSELRALLIKVGKKLRDEIPADILDEIVEDMLKEDDTDKNGVLDREEFKKTAEFIYDEVFRKKL